MAANRNHYVTSVDDIHTGSKITFAAKADGERYQRYYDGDFSQLFKINLISKNRNRFEENSSDATVENGLKQLEKHGILRLNFFKAFSDFYRDSIWGTPPDVISVDDSFNTWWGGNRRRIMNSLRDALQYWSINNRGVLVITNDGNITSVNPNYYVPVVAPYNTSIVTGHILVYTYYENDSADPNPEWQRVTTPNRVRIVKFSEVEGRNEADTYYLAGGTVGEKISTEPTDTVGVVAFGDGDSVYDDIEDAAKTVMIRLSQSNLVLNKHASPQYQGPSGFINRKRTQTELVDKFGNPYISLPPEARTGIQAITWDAHLNESERLVSYLMNLQSVFGGVPKNIFGAPQEEVPASGQGANRLMLKTIATINEMRETLEYVLRDIFSYMGAPGWESATINFIQNPFATFFEQGNSAIAQYQAGAITRNELREVLKYNVREDSDVFSDPRPSVASARMQDDTRDNKESER